MAGKTLQRIKALVGAVDFIEFYTLGLIVIGLPLVAYIWTGQRVAVSVFIVVNIALGLISLRGRN